MVMHKRVMSMVAAVVWLSGCATRVSPHEAAHPPHGGPLPDDTVSRPVAGQKVLDLATVTDLAAILDTLNRKRVVFVGEVHDRFDHHLNQLAVIKGLHEKGVRLAIGMEYFQQPFQQHLDDYIIGAIDESDLLQRTEYYVRWRFDFRNYDPILRYAREQGIPLVALNVATEIVNTVSDKGFEGLDAEQQRQVPESIDRSDEAYRQRLRRVYDQHPGDKKRNFERFVDVQLLWDESMAAAAARYLKSHPGRSLVVLAGNGHLSYGAGIPSRLARRLEMEYAILLNGGGVEDIEPDAADFLILSAASGLPPGGRLGLYLKEQAPGVFVEAFAEGSAAEAAGVRSGDRIVAVDGRAIDRYADVKVALWHKRPGDRVAVKVQRKSWLGSVEDLSHDVVLN